MDTFLSDKAPAGAAAFFFIVNEVTMQEVSEKVLDEEATAKVRPNTSERRCASRCAPPRPLE